MSWKASGYVKGLNNGMTRSEKLLMLIISDYFDESLGYAWPTVDRLAQDAMLTENHVFKLLRSLKEKGLLTVDSGKPHRSSNRYSFPGLEVRPLKMRPLTTDRSDLSSPRGVAVNEPTAEEDQTMTPERMFQAISEVPYIPVVFEIQNWRAYSQNFVGDLSGFDAGKFHFLIQRINDARILRANMRNDARVRFAPLLIPGAGQCRALFPVADVLAVVRPSKNKLHNALMECWDEIPLDGHNALVVLSKHVTDFLSHSLEGS